MERLKANVRFQNGYPITGLCRKRREWKIYQYRRLDKKSDNRVRYKIGACLIENGKPLPEYDKLIGDFKPLAGVNRL